MGRRHVLKDVADKKIDPTKKHVTKGGRIDLGTSPKEAEPVDVVVEEVVEEVEVEKILDVKPSFKKLSSTSTPSKTTRKTRSTRSKNKDS
ncbi:MAG: hypothetical protein ACW98X_23805 [Promethearchaeota archaeon]